MSLTAALRPSALSFPANLSNRLSGGAGSDASQTTLRHDSNYITLSRMLLRYQHLILLTPSPTSAPIYNDTISTDLSPLQRQIQAELWSPLPYHRTKWLHSIENARTLLIQLERTAQSIKVQRVKQEALKDLASKRAVIKALRNRVEEIGREIESMGEEAWQLNSVPEGEETVADILARKKPRRNDTASQSGNQSQEGRPVSHVEQEHDGPLGTGKDPANDREALFGSSPSSTIRRRPGQDASSPSKPESLAETSGFSNLKSTERALLDSSREHEDLTADLISMAAQLKQQARAFQFSLDLDKGLLNRALEGLDRNIGGMEAASKNMAFLRRMSEGEGWLGRMKLYAMIFGMWVLAILLVFVGPKLRF